MKERCDSECSAHPLKTPERVEQILAISGLSRILLNSVVNLEFVPIEYKAFVFATSAEFREGELPHEAIVSIPSGHILNILQFWFVNVQTFYDQISKINWSIPLAVALLTFMIVDVACELGWINLYQVLS